MTYLGLVILIEHQFVRDGQTNRWDKRKDMDKEPQLTSR